MRPHAADELIDDPDEPRERDQTEDDKLGAHSAPVPPVGDRGAADHSDTVRVAASRRDAGRRPHWAGRAAWPARRVVGALLLSAVVGGAVTGAASLVRGPSYTSESAVIWNPGAVQYADPDFTVDPNLLDRQVTDQQDIIVSDAVLASASSDLGVSADDLREDVTTSVATGSSLIAISATADSPRAAKEITSTVTTAYVTYLQDSGRQSLTQRADVLQATIDRQNTQLSELSTQVQDLTNQLSELATTSPTYAIVQIQLNQAVQRVNDVAARQADSLDQQQTLRANAQVFPGEASVLQQASAPKGPSSFSVPVSVAIGAALGLLVVACAIGFALTRGGTGPSDELRP